MKQKMISNKSTAVKSSKPIKSQKKEPYLRSHHFQTWYQLEVDRERIADVIRERTGKRNEDLLFNKIDEAKGQPILRPGQRASELELPICARMLNLKPKKRSIKHQLKQVQKSMQMQKQLKKTASNESFGVKVIKAPMKNSSFNIKNRDNDENFENYEHFENVDNKEKLIRLKRYEYNGPFSYHRNKYRPYVMTKTQMLREKRTDRRLSGELDDIINEITGSFFDNRPDSNSQSDISTKYSSSSSEISSELMNNLLSCGWNIKDMINHNERAYVPTSNKNSDTTISINDDFFWLDDIDTESILENSCNDLRTLRKWDLNGRRIRKPKVINQKMDENVKYQPTTKKILDNGERLRNEVEKFKKKSASLKKRSIETLPNEDIIIGLFD